MTNDLNDCLPCLDGSAAVKEVGFFELTARICIQCGRMVDVGKGSGTSGRLTDLESASLASEPEPHVEESEAEISTRMYLIQNSGDVEVVLNEKLEVSRGTKCCFHQNAMDALADITAALHGAGSIRVVLFNPEVMDSRGSALLYSIRALEMSLGSPSTPILVLGETVSPSMERAIKECKNAKFVSIGRKTDAAVLANRYLTVIKKLASG